MYRAAKRAWAADTQLIRITQSFKAVTDAAALMQNDLCVFNIFSFPSNCGAASAPVPVLHPTITHVGQYHKHFRCPKPDHF